MLYIHYRPYPTTLTFIQYLPVSDIEIFWSWVVASNKGGNVYFYISPPTLVEVHGLDHGIFIFPIYVTLIPYLNPISISPISGLSGSAEIEPLYP